MSYVVYPTPTSSSGFYISEVPSGFTASTFATAMGLTMAVCAEFELVDFDAGAENFPQSFYVIDNQPLANDAAFSLAQAKDLATLKTKGNYSILQQAALNGYNPQVLASQATLPELSRIPAIQAAIENVNNLAVQLELELVAIAAATTATELSDITNPPYGTLFTGRGAGVGPEDLNVSYYTDWNSASMLESDTELYVPGTSTVIAYGSGGPGQFDSAGNCFNPGNYLIQIRQASTSRVIAEFTVPLNAAGENVAFGQAPFT
jgi:hypothetical protein